MSLFVFFISLLIVAQHVSGNHVPIIRSWRLRDIIASCRYVPWLWEGCQVRLAGSASMDGFVRTHPWTLPANRTWQPDILSAIYSRNLCLRSFVDVSYHIPHLYKISGEIKVLYMYIKVKFNRCIHLDGYKVMSQWRRWYSDLLRAVCSRDRILVGGEVLPTITDRPWCLPSLLYDRHQVINEGKAAG